MTRNIVNVSEALRPLIIDDESVIVGEEFWIVIFDPARGYLAAWVDENGDVHTAIRKTVKGAANLADRSWGR